MIEGGELQLVHPDNKQIISMDLHDYKVSGNETIRFFDNVPFTKVYAEISEDGAYINGNLEVTDKIKWLLPRESRISKQWNCPRWKLVSVQMSPHNAM